MHGQSICCISTADVKSSPLITPFTPDLDGIQIGPFPAFPVMPNLQSTPSRPSTPTPFCPKRLLTRALMASALLGGAGAALSAGSAQAGNWPGQNTTVGDKYFHGWLSNLSNDQCASDTQECDVSVTANGIWDVDASPTSLGAHFAPSGFLEYFVDITDPTKSFQAVALDFEFNALLPKPTVTKDIWYCTGSGTGCNTIVDLSLTGQDQLTSFAPGVQFIRVRDSWVTPDGGQLEGFTNNFSQTSTVPGPLPVLGAGVAFGFSRKLRRRIQGDRVKA